MNAFDPIEVIDDGRFISFNAEQLENEFEQSFLIEEGSVIFVNVLISLKLNSSNDSTPSVNKM